MAQPVIQKFPISTLMALSQEVNSAMPTTPACPQCAMTNTYPDGDNCVCADCGHEWPLNAAPEEETSDAVVKDANGNVLANGDAVVPVK